MMRLKACPRCRGDLEVQRNEVDDVEVSCFQCGYRKFGRVSDSQMPTKGEAIRATKKSPTHITKPRVLEDRVTRTGGVHRRVPAAVSTATF
jgi:Zn ribbon nucleic-acid-binding protein